MVCDLLRPSWIRLQHRPCHQKPLYLERRKGMTLGSHVYQETGCSQKWKWRLPLIVGTVVFVGIVVAVIIFVGLILLIVKAVT